MAMPPSDRLIGGAHRARPRSRSSSMRRRASSWSRARRSAASVAGGDGRADRLDGRIEDCLHEDDGGDDGDAAPLIANLCADGYRVASTPSSTPPRRRIRRTRDRHHDPPDGTNALASSYYVGPRSPRSRRRALGDRAAQPSATLARALEHLATTRPRAPRSSSPLRSANADVAPRPPRSSSHATSPRPRSRPIERALTVEPEWPLHTGTRCRAPPARRSEAVASTRCAGSCRRARCRPASTRIRSAGRVALAERMMADLERTARVTARACAAPSRTTTKKSRARR